MAVPKFYELMKPLLEVIGDGNIYTMAQIKPMVSSKIKLSEEGLRERLPSGTQTVYTNRIGWAKTYLKNAGLLTMVARATFKITEQGLNVLKDNPHVIDKKYLSNLKNTQENLDDGEASSTDDTQQCDKIVNRSDINDAYTPDDIMEGAYNQIMDSLADEVLIEVAKLSSAAFEQFVVDLLIKMGYGSFDKAGCVTATSGDEGIDGVIKEDKLGFGLIFIQAKKWDINTVINRPEIQKFIGSIVNKGGKGLFITTAKFSSGAQQCANLAHIVLVDGKSLAKLMIEHDFCVTTKKTLLIKAIDTDAFNDYEEM